MTIRQLWTCPHCGDSRQRTEVQVADDFWVGLFYGTCSACGKEVTLQISKDSPLYAGTALEAQP